MTLRLSRILSRCLLSEKCLSSILILSQDLEEGLETHLVVVYRADRGLASLLADVDLNDSKLGVHCFAGRTGAA